MPFTRPDQPHRVEAKAVSAIRSQIREREFTQSLLLFTPIEGKAQQQRTDAGIKSRSRENGPWFRSDWVRRREVRHGTNLVVATAFEHGADAKANADQLLDR